jgi:tetratricopeptide (TPR) repeat protein
VRVSSFRVIALTALLMATMPRLAYAATVTPPSFREGCEAYAAGAYDQAAALFQALAQREPSPGAYHNLGNAEWKRGRPGEAILAWEKAQWLSPFTANTRANLRFARQKAQLPSPALAWYEICSTWLPVPAWALLASASLWLALALVLLPGIWRWRKADWHHALAAGSLAVFLLSIPALVGVHTRSKLGVIRSQDTPLRLTPTQEAQTLGRLPAGEVARLERERGPYVYIRTGNDAAGWVARAQFGRITDSE